jgi:tetratricopeptide (TPR) repeat protein
MHPERFETIKALLGSLEAIAPGERSAFLDRACAGDPVLRSEVESLLAATVPPIMQTGGLAAHVLPLMADAAISAGRRIGPYRLLDVLGEGGMGVVYRAEQIEPIRREVALKLVPLGMDSAQVLSRFELERQALAMMNHPNIAQALDAGASEEGRPYFVMELVRGEPLTDYCARERPSLAVRLKLFLQVCEAIQHAHQRGIIHRDLKPTNVLLTTNGAELVPKVIDFGIAKAIGEVENRLHLSTIDGQIVGTPEYMSPEQAGLIDGGLDTRSDVYSLGVMLYELVSGRRPYELKRRTAIELERALRGPLVPPSQGATPGKRTTRGDAARDLDAVVLMAMERLPDERYASVEQLADDVRCVIDHRPVRARMQTWAYRARRFVRRNAAGVTIAAVIAALVTAGGVGIVLQRNRAIASERRAVSEAARARAEADKASAVAQFLTDLFRESDPAQSRGAAITARELLDRGADRLATDLASQDVTRATLMDTIGVVYRLLGMTDAAEKIATDALNIRRRVLGAEAADVAASLDNLGLIAIERTRYQQAEQRHREALAIRRKLLDPSDPAIAQSLSNLALTLRERGQYDEAETLVREALAIRRLKLGPEHNDTLVSMNVLGDIESSRGRFADAGRLYEEVLAIRRRILPPNHPRVATSIHNVGDTLARAGKLAEAEAMYREALAIRREILPSDHPDITATELNLASTLHDLGRLDEAEPLLRSALDTDRRRNGNQHMDVAIDLNNLASLLEDRGKLQEAGKLYEESMAIRLTLQGEMHPSIPTILSNIGRLRLTEGALADAERALRRAIDLRRALKLEAHPRQATTIAWLGRVYATRGLFAEAEQQYQAALAIERAATPSGSLGAAGILLSLGHLKLQRGDAAGAEPFIREALTQRQKGLPAGHRSTGDAEAALADCLIRQSRFGDAEPLLLSALKTAPSWPTSLFYNQRAVRALLVTTYENSGRPSDAAAYRPSLQPR